MGRTKRVRGRKFKFSNDLTQVINLQRSMRIKCSKIEIGFFKDTGRGVRCKKKIEKGDIIIALPLNHLITTKSASHIFDDLEFDDQSPQLLLTILLIYEAHLEKNSKYFHYIESLPESYSNLYFCSETEVKLFPSFLKDELNKQKSSLEKIFNELHELLGTKTCIHCGVLLKTLFSHDKFTWAWFTVNTRSVYYKDEGSLGSLALAPLLDMFNHSNKADTNMSIDFEKELYILKSLNEYKKFEQVFIKYGFHSNLKLLLEYGFVGQENANDFVEFSFQEVIKAVKMINFAYGDVTKLKYQFIKSNKLNENLTKNKDEFSWAFKGLIYVLITKDQDLNTLLSKIYSSEFSETENQIIKKIEDILVTMKYKELSDCLLKMETIKKCTDSFSAAKDLMKIHLKLLLPS